MLKVGDIAPEIDQTTTTGEPFRLSEQRGRWVVVFFFPKATTPTCTKESRAFQHALPELSQHNAAVVGISTDPLSRQCEFSGDLGLAYPLLGDSDHRIAKSYQVLWPLLGMTRRVTYLINPEQRIAKVFWNEFAGERHAHEALAHLRRIAAG